MENLQVMEPINITTYTFWTRKSQFALEKDLYSWWTVFAVEEGRFAYQIGNKSGEAGFGDLVFCPPNIWFHRRTIEPLTFHFIHFAVEINTMDGSPPLLPAGAIHISDTERLSSCYKYLRALTDRTDQEAVRWRLHLFQDIILLYQMEKSIQVKKAPEGDVQSEMLWAKEYIKGKAFGDISMRELAEWLGFTPVQLTRRFRSTFGLTPSEYLTKLRIERVSRLLEETTLSLDEIADKVGYENGFYLSRVFSKHKGMNPSVYRKMRLV